MPIVSKVFCWPIPIDIVAAFTRLARWKKVVVVAAVVLISAIIGMTRPPDLSYRTQMSDTPDHYTPKGYANPWPDDRPVARYRDLIKLIWENPSGRPGYKSSLNSIAVSEPNWPAINAPGDDLVLTWIGHATFLIQTSGMNILTDPNLSDRASPVSFAGPRRITRPGIAIDSLPPIDAVFVSHNHYDHLDKRTVLALGNGPQWFVPLGLGKWFRKNGISNVVELDWWQSHNLTEDVTVMCIPAKHFSARTMWDRDEVLWSSWMIESGGKKVYFAGDTGYGPHFGEIGERVGPIDVALLPIGAYAPRWFMSPMHINPKEAIQAQFDLKAKRSVAMHWGTFLLTVEPLLEPPRLFREYADSAGLTIDDAIIVGHGETLVFP